MMKSKFLYAAAAVLSLAVISTAVIAKRSNEVEITYYENGKMVGGKHYSCWGGYSQWGKVTAYSTTDSTPCGDY